MPIRSIGVFVFLVLLIPSARFAWVNREMSSFGRIHDDGMLFVSAKSLATGGGYRILSLPEAPAQTKYPVLYPLYLSMVWRLNPRFPENLKLAALFCWITVAAAMALAWLYYRGQGFSERRIWWMLAAMAINPWLLVTGSTMFSDTFFMCFALATMIAIEKPGARMALVAGMLAGCAYLTRTAGIVLLISVPAVLLWRRERARAAIFAAAMLPFVIGWMAWSRVHMKPSSDLMVLYYTNYLALQWKNVGLDNLALVLWKNVDAFLNAVGAMICPQVVGIPLEKTLTQAIGVAMIVGIVRLARRGVGTQYALFSALSAAILVVWHAPPTERLVLPLSPLLMAGMVEETDHFSRMLRGAFRHRERSQRAAAYVLGSFATLFAAFAIATQVWISVVYLPRLAHSSGAFGRDIRVASEWIAGNLPPSARIITGDDPLIYLYSGRQGELAPFLTRWQYAGDHDSFIQPFREIASYGRKRGFEYVLATDTDDLDRPASDEDRATILRDLQQNPELKRVFETGMVTLYRIEPRSLSQMR